MKSTWTVIDTGISSPKTNMSIDEELLANLKETKVPILHLYDWNGPCATYGHFMDPKDLICLSEAKALKLELARRPTGGGMIFHLTDWAFSVLVPANHPGYSVNTLDNYAFINQLVMDVVGEFCGKQAELTLLPKETYPKETCNKRSSSRHFCMAKPTCLDVMLNGKKVSGGAQRRTRFGFLHQGTISLALPSEEFLERILVRDPSLPSDSNIKALMQANTMPLLSEKATPQEITKARTHLAHLFKQTLLHQKLKFISN